MININDLRKKFDEISNQIKTRNKNCYELDEFRNIDKKWRETVTKLQKLKSERNSISERIAISVNKKNDKIIDKLKLSVKKIKEEIEEISKEEIILSKKLTNIMFCIPNIPDKTVPVGKDETENVVVRKFGTPIIFDFEPLPHWELAKKLDLLDFERAAKNSGSRYTIFKKNGARLMRALRNFTLDIHISNGYVEVLPPIILNSDPLYGLGKLPKFEDDLFKLTNGQYLSATEELPLTAMFKNEILNEDELPIKLTSSSISFRSEAGSAGKDTRGVIRQHQFYNTELVIFDKPSNSMKTLEKMTHDAETILQQLNLPYRILNLCTGDLGIAATKTYDIEVWFPCNNKYREVSSCSNDTDFQSRGLNIKFKNKNNDLIFAHTLNGTGVSLNRLWIAVIENYQQKDGTITIPKALQKYMNGEKIIK